MPAAELTVVGGVCQPAAGDIRWYLWDAGEQTTGWSLRLAVEDPAEGLAWAVSATDTA